MRKAVHQSCLVCICVVAAMLAAAPAFAAGDTNPPQPASVQMAAPQDADAADKAEIKTATPVPPPPPAPEDILRPVTVGSITYITGGIGNDEKAALKSVEKKYNLHILLAMKDGQFVADGRIVIRDKKGNQLLDADAGPIFYASLPAGKYSVEAFHDDQSRKDDDVTVGKDGTDNEKSYFTFTW